MKKIFLIAVVTLITLQLSFAQQIIQNPNLRKMSIVKDLKPIYAPKKNHPIEKMMKVNTAGKGKSRNNDKLLVLLIDFQEDDDTETTGNGKFNLAETATYPIPIDSPPHDNVYFSNELIALNLYYKAVSFGSLDVQFDVYPAIGSENMAYTLPHEMAYYNPGLQDNDLMVTRFEEYFHDAFTEADKDEDIIFANYDHFMFIHAGSDWQHDRNGDSPHDIPSFFISVGDDKEVIVDDGATIITHACNIPETITQDVREENGIHFNYGVINSVMVHEFGHSLGFVDLYNTSNNTPGVGFYDIMDSGGSVMIGYRFDGIPGIENDVFYLEGTNPIFPGAYSRTIPFEDYFRSIGIMKDISELPFDEDIAVLPSSMKYNLNELEENELFFVKIPISDTEYLLVENRQVDPDGDGGTTPIGGLGSFMGNRVIYGPSSTDDGDYQFNYEYDYLLPGWIDSDGNNFGGGLLVWHVDEKILYENNNFENNSVNTNYFNRAVKILEADNIQDIANPYSHFWQGTAFDPFFKYMPIIDERGFFEGWDNRYQTNPDGSIEFVGKIASDELSASSQPILATNDGTPSIFRLYDISSYDVSHQQPNSGYEGRKLSFKFGTNLFDKTDVEKFDSTVKEIGVPGKSFGLNTLPIITSELHLFSKLMGDWDEHLGEAQDFDFELTQPISAFDLDGDGNDEYIIISENKLFTYDGEDFFPIEYSSNIASAPLFLEADNLLIVPTENNLYIGFESLEIGRARLAYNGSEIVAVSENIIYFISPNGDVLDEIEIPNLSSEYYPICYDDLNDDYDATFIQDGLGAIWKINGGNAEKIFELSSYTTELPTNLAIAEILDDGVPYLVFGSGDRTFAITTSGTLAPSFPGYLEDRTFTAGEFPEIVKIDNKMILYLPSEQSFLAVDNRGDLLLEYCLSWNMSDAEAQLFWLEDDQSLNFVYADESSVYLASKNNVTLNPILWRGFRNNGYSLYVGNIPDFAVTDNLRAEVFPNPVTNGEARIRVYNATDNVSIKIYDIAGNKIFSNLYQKENSNYQDLIWSCPKVSSGIYFAVIKSGSEIKKLSIAITK